MLLGQFLDYQMWVVNPEMSSLVSSSVILYQKEADIHQNIDYNVLVGQPAGIIISQSLYQCITSQYCGFM